jgi:predicted PurR-regulated permease PerM
MSVGLTNMFQRRIGVPKFVSNLGDMARGFFLANWTVASIMAAGMSLVFLVLGMNGAMALGIVSVILILVSFLGLVLASALPLAAAPLQLNTIGPFVTIAITVLSFYLIAANFLIPTFVGSRLLVGPLRLTTGMLFWGWLWGIVGFLLAVLLTTLVKRIADSCRSLTHLSNLLSEDPCPMRRSARIGEYTIQRMKPYLKGRTHLSPSCDPPPSGCTVMNNPGQRPWYRQTRIGRSTVFHTHRDSQNRRLCF